MDQPNETKATEPTPQQVGTFMAAMANALSAKVEQEKKFKNVYANNFHFEPSAWDLKIVLGQLEQHTGVTEIDWHTALTIPWLQVTFVAYYLRVQAAWHEMQGGSLKAPSYVMPPVPKPPSPELAEKDPFATAFYEKQKRIYDEMFSS
jgi:hypothetical protein